MLAAFGAALLARRGDLPNYFGSLTFGRGVLTSVRWLQEKRDERQRRAEWAIPAAVQKRRRKGFIRLINGVATR